MAPENLGTYYCFFPVRDGERTVSMVMESLIKQTYLPAKIIAINDGSTDCTQDILEGYRQMYPGLVEIINTGSTTRDYKRIPLLWNMSLRRAYDYHLIAAGDVSFAPDYCEKMLVQLRRDPDLVICSGDYGNSGSVAPHGAGRFVRQSFFYENYERYPAIVGYESEILERALMLNKKIAVFGEATFEHLDRLGHAHNFSEFGYAMKSLGYYPPYVLSRFVWNFLRNKSVGRKGALQMLGYYLSFNPAKDGYYSRFPEDIRRAISERQKKYIGSLARRAVRKCLRSIYRSFVVPPPAQTTTMAGQKRGFELTGIRARQAESR
jgi:glycosyltransferase involved in cell wall biosynthesis